MRVCHCAQLRHTIQHTTALLYWPQTNAFHHGYVNAGRLTSVHLINMQFLLSDLRALQTGLQPYQRQRILYYWQRRRNAPPVRKIHNIFAHDFSVIFT